MGLRGAIHPVARYKDGWGEAIHLSVHEATMDCFASLAMTPIAFPRTELSSPANGSRECAPDDRLRRGIQYAAAHRFYHCCLWNTGSPAFRLRSLSFGGQVAGDND